MASIIPGNNGEASMAVWLSGGVMTCLAVACPLLKESYVDGSLSVIPLGLVFLAACFVFNAMQLGRIKIYGPYVLPFPVASAIPWPVLHGTHLDLTSRIPPVVSLTSLLIWNGPTIAAMVSTSCGGKSRSIHTIPEALPSSGSSSANSLSPRQGLDTFLRTHSWVNSPDRPLLLPVVSPRTRSAADDASCYVSRSNSEGSISLSDILPSSWAGHAHATSRNTDLTLVETGLMMSDYSTSLRSHRHGFYGRRHGSIRSMSPVYMEG